MWWLIPVGIIALILAVVIIRTLMFKPKASVPADQTIEEFDGDKAIDDLCKILSCKTVSFEDKTLEDDKEFRKLIDLLPTLYPNVFIDWIEKYQSYLKPGALLTDVTGVKVPVVYKIQEILQVKHQSNFQTLN